MTQSDQKTNKKNDDVSLGDDFLDDLLSEANTVKISKKQAEFETETSESLVNEEQKEDSENPDLSKKSMKELRQLAKEAGLTGYSKLKKIDILEQLMTSPVQQVKESDSLLSTDPEDDEEETFTANEVLNEAQNEEEEENWILKGPPTLNDPSSVRDPIDILTSYRDEKGKTIVTDKLLGSLKKRFTAISEIATLPGINELISLSGIGEQTASKIWRISQQYHNLNAKTAKTLLKQKSKSVMCSTGSQVLDELLGGGIETKNLTEFFGEASMGKTQICYTAAVYALLQKAEGGFMDFDPHSPNRARVVWLDTEGTFKSDRIVEIVKERFPNKDPEYFLDNIIYFQILSTDMLLNAINSVFQMPDNIVLVVLDSLMSPFRFEAWLVTNQATTKMNMYGPMSITTVDAAGGFAVAHAVTHRIKLTKKSAGKNKGIILRKATVVDSPTIGQGEAEFVLASEGVTDFEKGSIKTKSAKVSSSIEGDLESEDDVEDDILA
jgi:DNA repair protein RadA